ncbi:MAG: hypothetical protein FJW31_13170 [Acidobacteria bacterium]|nr:hypothetical protein [Acidobacteriota bacterium]
MMVATHGDEALEANTTCNRPLDTNGLGDFRMNKLYGRGQCDIGGQKMNSPARKYNCVRKVAR